MCAFPPSLFLTVIWIRAEGERVGGFVYEVSGEIERH
jgi:hypothetical protein